jgi:hypothetical protein
MALVIRPGKPICHRRPTSIFLAILYSAPASHGPQVSETFNVQFRWEIFNIFNHANFNPPAPAARQIFTPPLVWSKNYVLKISRSSIFGLLH